MSDELEAAGAAVTAGLAASQVDGASATPAARAELIGAIDEARADVAQHEAALASARNQRAGVADAELDLTAARKTLQVVEAALAAFDKTAADAPSGAASSAEPRTAALSAHIETGHAALDEAIRQQLKNPELAFYRLKNTAYKFSFMLIPISLPFLWR